MREIKFRAWDSKRNEMLTGNNGLMMFLTSGVLAWQFGNDLDITSSYTKQERYSLMQYTGLKDNNGVEIYEGDILKRSRENNPNFLLEVGFDPLIGFYGTTEPGQFHKKPLSYMMSYDGARYDEVIGNIYQTQNYYNRKSPKLFR